MLQSTPPREGGDAELAQLSGRKYQLQSTPPREGGDRFIIIFIHAHRSFNPRPPARGATLTKRWYIDTIPLQSTPPREGGDIQFPYRFR